jgi:hypothetical protein
MSEWRKIEAALSRELELDGWGIHSAGLDRYAGLGVELESGSTIISINLTALAKAVEDDLK